MRIVNIDLIEPSYRLAKPVYGDNNQILLKQGTILKPEFIERLKRLGFTSLYIDDGLIDDVKIDEVISEKTRQQALQHLIETTKDFKNNKFIKVSSLKKVVTDIIDDIIANKDMMVNLSNISTYDNYTFNHSINVTVLSVMIGICLHYPLEQLHKLGLGVLLHDIGKLNIPLKILNKTGTLSKEEFEVIKKHTSHGFEILRANPEISITSAHVAFQHHERYNGSGYPRGLRGNNIIEYARVAAIADVFDAMSTDRCYRKRIPSDEVYKFLLESADTHFDSYILDRFIQKIAVYPQGTLVQLNNGNIGFVIKQNPMAPESPVVRLFYEHDGTELPSPVEINLLHKPDLKIAKVMDEKPRKLSSQQVG